MYRQVATRANRRQNKRETATKIRVNANPLFLSLAPLSSHVQSSVTASCGSSTPVCAIAAKCFVSTFLTGQHCVMCETKRAEPCRAPLKIYRCRVAVPISAAITMPFRCRASWHSRVYTLAMQQHYCISLSQPPLQQQ